VKARIISAAVHGLMVGLALAAVLLLPAIEGTRLLRAARERVDSDDVTAIIATGATIARHSDRTLDKADALIDAAKTSTQKSIDSQQAAINAANKFKDVAAAALKAVQRADSNLNDENGVLPSAAAALRGFEPVLTELAGLAGAARDTVTDVDSLLNDNDFREGYKAGIEALKNTRNATGNVARATDVFAGILEDIRHPEKPSKFIRGLGFMFSVVRALGPSAAALLK
jgi:hypothetical protein